MTTPKVRAKRPLAASLAALVLYAIAPAATAQVFPLSNSNTAIAGMQLTHQTGAINTANTFGLSNQSIAAPAPLAPTPIASEPSFNSAPSHPGSTYPAYPAPSHGSLVGSLFGGQPLVNTNIAVGNQTTVQNGDNNAASSILGQGQTISTPPGAFGGLVNTNIAVGNQTTVQNGLGNFSGSGLGQGQSVR